MTSIVFAFLKSRLCLSFARIRFSLLLLLLLLASLCLPRTTVSAVRRLTRHAGTHSLYTNSLSSLSPARIVPGPYDSSTRTLTDGMCVSVCIAVLQFWMGNFMNETTTSNSNSTTDSLGE